MCELSRAALRRGRNLVARGSVARCKGWLAMAALVVRAVRACRFGPFRAARVERAMIHVLTQQLRSNFSCSGRSLGGIAADTRR
jgi:hypothetical protein